MAKQTFTTGQVLTAAQMTSLQQTAMGGGSTTAKTASYVLVAADAGTVVQMNSASATTITVNTALFAAGDTVQIQNVGAGVCTVTAGTATVSTSATLALKQYDAGTLYFNSTSASIFFAVDAADGMTNPFTTTGDTVYASGGTTPTRLGIGTVGQVLTVNSGATAPEWATASAGGMTLIATATPSAAASFNFTSIPSTYKHLLMQWRNFESTTGGSASAYGLVTVNNNAAANYNFRCLTATTSTLSQQSGTSLTSMMGTVDIGSQAFPAMYGVGFNLPQTGAQGEMWLWNYASSTTSGRIFSYKSTGTNQFTTNTYSANGFAGTTVNTAISRIDVTTTASTFSGVCYLYGVS